MQLQAVLCHELEGLVMVQGLDQQHHKRGGGLGYTPLQPQSLQGTLSAASQGPLPALYECPWTPWSPAVSWSGVAGQQKESQLAQEGP